MIKINLLGDALAQGGVALLVTRARPAQGHALSQVAVVADNGRLADDNAHAVVDKETFAYLCAGMYFDTGEKPAYMRNKSPNKKHLMLPEPMAQPIKQNRVKTRITEQDLKDTPCSRVTFKN